MKTISSEQLHPAERITLGDQTGLLNLYDGLQTPHTADTIVLSMHHQTQLEEFAVDAATHYTKEATLVGASFDLPSLIVRTDCTVDANGNILPYEMEDSPSGQGITDLLHRAAGADGIKDAILDHYQTTLGQIPHVIVSHSRNHGTDDHLIVGSRKYINTDHCPAELRKLDGPVIVKAIPGNVASHLPYLHLQAQAIAPLVSEGDKSYGERINLFYRLRSILDLLEDEGELESQVVKARLGSMALGISIYLTPADRLRFGKDGTVSKNRLVRDTGLYLTERDGALVQPFEAPLRLSNHESRDNAILRVFTLLERSPANQIIAKAIGGCFVARRGVKVHGASDAVAGAVLVQ